MSLASFRQPCIILRSVDTASEKPAGLVLPLAGEKLSTETLSPPIRVTGLAAGLITELWRTADAEACGLNLADFSLTLDSVGARLNYNLPAGTIPDAAQKAAFFRSLHLADLALAQACALGREPAWNRFLSNYRSGLARAAVSITGSATLGQELADSLYAELYGLRESEGERRSPLASFTGRGSLMGWLRATLVQRFRDHHRRTFREMPLDDIDCAAPESTAELNQLTPLAAAVALTLKGLPAEDRFLLSAYFLDRQTLLQIARTLGVHEATMSRRIKRLAGNTRTKLLENLASGGMSKAAAEEALGTDPRDIEINLRSLLQSSQAPAFYSQRDAAPGTADTR
jgi:RNA polymerase sigma-70 factor (ECF subfamily)